MLSATDGWASAAGQVLATNDGGATWVPETGPGQGGGSLFVPARGSPACQAMSRTPVFVTTPGANGVGIDLAVSRDGGTSWTDLHQTGLLAPVGVVSMTPLWWGGDEFSFPTPQDGWALWFAATPDAEAIVFRSQDGGRRWVPAGYLSMSSSFPGSPPPAGAPADVTFASPATGWITGLSYGGAWLYATRQTRRGR